MQRNGRSKVVIRAAPRCLLHTDAPGSPVSPYLSEASALLLASSLVLIGVASRTVVYGGAGSVRRSGAEAVPLGGFAGVLDGLEVDQEVSEFIRERRGPDPSESDIERVDAVYREHVRPTGDRLLRYCGEIGTGLFRSHEPRLVIEQLDSPVAQFDLTSTDRLPEESRWAGFRAALINAAGFGLNDEVPVRVAYRHRFRRYTGTSGGDFDTSLAVEWHLGCDAVVRSVAVDFTAASSAEATFAYCVLYDERDKEDNHLRFPVSGWLEGGLDDLADLIRLVSVPQKAVDQAADSLQAGIEQAAVVLDGMAETQRHVVRSVADMLGMRNVPQTRRMACAIIANALIFHERIAGMHEGINPLLQVCGPRRSQSADQDADRLGRDSQDQLLPYFRHRP